MRGRYHMSCSGGYDVELFARDENEAVFWASSPDDCSGSEDPGDGPCTESGSGGGGGAGGGVEAPARSGWSTPGRLQMSSASRTLQPLAIPLLRIGRWA